MARNNATWHLADGRGGYRHVSELPAAHVLVDNECGCLRPATPKADQTAQHFGNQLAYLPVIHSDANNAALALAELERSSVVRGTARKESPLLVGDAHGGVLTCDQIDRIFEALAFAALEPGIAAKRSSRSCRIRAACCHRATAPTTRTTPRFRRSIGGALRRRSRSTRASTRATTPRACRV